MSARASREARRQELLARLGGEQPDTFTGTTIDAIAEPA
jgi:hypothetical protein